jgi:hypothetical protein
MIKKGRATGLSLVNPAVSPELEVAAHLQDAQTTVTVDQIRQLKGAMDTIDRENLALMQDEPLKVFLWKLNAAVMRTGKPVPRMICIQAGVTKQTLKRLVKEGILQEHRAHLQKGAAAGWRKTEVAAYALAEDVAFQDGELIRVDPTLLQLPEDAYLTAYDNGGTPIEGDTVTFKYEAPIEGSTVQMTLDGQPIGEAQAVSIQNNYNKPRHIGAPMMPKEGFTVEAELTPEGKEWVKKMRRQLMDDAKVHVEYDDPEGTERRATPVTMPDDMSVTELMEGLHNGTLELVKEWQGDVLVSVNVKRVEKAGD